MLTRITGNSIQDSSISSQQLLYSNGPYSGLRNRIINGACEVAQRNNSFVVSSGLFGYGGPDRFVTTNNTTSGQFTQTKSTVSMPNGTAKYGCRQTVDFVISSVTAGNYWSGISQRIEGNNCYDLISKSVTVSFIFNSNISGLFPVAIRTVNSSFVTTINFTTPGIPTRFSVTTPAIPLNSGLIPGAGLGIEVNIGFINSGTYSSGLTNSWVNGVYVTTIGTANWGSSINNFIEVTELQLEEGTNATPFERRSYGTELSLCQRYFETSYPTGVAIGSTTDGSGAIFNLAAFSGNFYSFGSLRFNTRKRTQPTMTAYNPSSGIAGDFRNYSNNSNGCVAGFAFVSDSGVGQISCPSNNLSINNAYAFHFTASAEL